MSARFANLIAKLLVSLKVEVACQMIVSPGLPVHCSLYRDSSQDWLQLWIKFYFSE